MLILAPATAVPVGADRAVFQNGDRLTGEVKKLERGQLSFKTDATHTIQITWTDIASLESRETFLVELVTGERHLGTIGTASDGEMLVLGESQTWTLPLLSVVRLTPIKENLWKRLDGHIDLGFSFTEADDRTQISLSAESSYRTPKYVRTLSLNTIQAFQKGVDETNRQDLSLVVSRLLAQPKRLLSLMVSLQRNEELGLDLRSLVGAASGWNVVQNNSEVLGLSAGLAVTQERLVGEPDLESLEAVLGLGYQNFRFDRPERDIDLQLLVFPSLTDTGRVRAELSAGISWEVVRDFFLGLTVLESYDSEPPIPGATKSDLSVTTSFGWKF